MSVDIIIDAQGGDGGKGHASAYLSSFRDYDIGLRVSCAQAGHSHYIDGERVGFAFLPGGFINPSLKRLLVGAGSIISVKKILSEIKIAGLTPERLGIDYRATIITKEHLEEERANSNLMGKVGSVGTGVGICRREKIMRNPNLLHARDIPELGQYLTDTVDELSGVLENEGNVLLEGDHGAKLDLVHGEYPFVTSRIVNASGFLGEAGIGPGYTRDIYVVIKPYPTRVGPGPLEGEIFDERVLEWAHTIGGETGTVSKRLRRLGKFEWENVLKVMRMNFATKIVITHLDCPDFVWNALGYNNSEEFIQDVEDRLCHQPPYPRISLLSHGPRIEDIISLPN